MPAISPKAHVLVTGANGFMTVWVIQRFLQNGYRVLGVVRSAPKGDYLKTLFTSSKFNFPSDQFDYVVVEDLFDSKQLEQHIVGRDIKAIVHTASPSGSVSGAKDIWKDVIEPAVKAATSVLESAERANKQGASIKRIVFTSSVAAVIEPQGPAYEYTENDWNENAVKLAQANNFQDPLTGYSASKVLAEKAAWEFLEKHPNSGFDLVTINPPFILGPAINECPTPSGLIFMNAFIWAFLDPNAPSTKKEALNSLIPWGNAVDLRDTGEAHVRAAEIEEAGGKRLLISTQRYTVQDILDIIHSEPAKAKLGPKYTQLIQKTAVGKPGASAEINAKQCTFSHALSNKVIGFKPRPFEDTVIDMAKSLWDQYSPPQ